MALKKYRFPTTVGIHDPSQDEPEVRDHVTGQLVQPYRKGVKHLPPGTEVEMEDEQAQRIFAAFGTYEAWEARQNVPRDDASTKFVR